MSDEMKFGLSDLVINDDLDIALDNENYQDQVNPAPPVAGNYRAKALTLDYRKDQQGQPTYKKGQYPVFVLGQAELVEGLVDATGNPTQRKVGLFYDVDTMPIQRFGTVVSGLGDLTRSYGTANWNGLSEGIERLREAFEQGQLFTAQFDWSAYDKEFKEAAFAQLNLDPKTRYADRDEEGKKVSGAIYRASEVIGMRHFPFNNGRFSHVLQRGNVVMKNPVTNAPVTIEVGHRTLEARLTITRFFPNVDFEAGRVKIGPLNVKPAAQALASAA